MDSAGVGEVKVSLGIPCPAGHSSHLSFHLLTLSSSHLEDRGIQEQYTVKNRACYEHLCSYGPPHPQCSLQ